MRVHLPYLSEVEVLMLGVIVFVKRERAPPNWKDERSLFFHLQLDTVVLVGAGWNRILLVVSAVYLFSFTFQSVLVSLSKIMSAPFSLNDSIAGE